MLQSILRAIAVIDVSVQEKAIVGSFLRRTVYVIIRRYCSDNFLLSYFNIFHFFFLKKVDYSYFKFICCHIINANCICNSLQFRTFGNCFRSMSSLLMGRNHLANEKSSYLLQHANNLVYWSAIS